MYGPRVDWVCRTWWTHTRWSFATHTPLGFSLDPTLNLCSPKRLFELFFQNTSSNHFSKTPLRIYFPKRLFEFIFPCVTLVFAISVLGCVTHVFHEAGHTVSAYCDKNETAMMQYLHCNPSVPVYKAYSPRVTTHIFALILNPLISQSLVHHAKTFPPSTWRGTVTHIGLCSLLKPSKHCAPNCH